MLADLVATPPKIEDFVAQIHTNRAEVVYYEWNAILVAVASKGGDIGDELGPRRADGCAGFPHCLFGRPDFRTFFPGHPEALVPGGKHHVHFDSWVQFEFGIQRKP